MMNTPAHDATRFVRPALRSIVLYFLVVVISSTTMIKPAQAEGTVSTAVLYKGGTNNDGYDCTSMISVGAVQSCEMAKRQYWLERDHDNLVNYPVANAYIATCSAPVLNDFGPSGSYVDHFSIAYYRNELQCGFYSCIYSACIPYNNGFYIYTALSCPAHSTATGTTTCTCDTGYVPDSAGTSCVLEQEQYTLSLHTPGQVEPSGSASVTVTVINTLTKQPKEGAAVSIEVEVEANSGGHDHHDANRPKGSLSGGGSTGPDGKATFTFKAPEVSGTHTFTAQCDSPTCTNNPQKDKIDVKVDGLATIPASVFYRPISPNADTNHPNTHYLKPGASTKLAEIAKAYYKSTYLLKDGWLPNVMLNDASLEWGGVLDCFMTCANSVPWGASHAEHRRGSVIDIRARIQPVNNPRSDSLLYEDQFRENALNAGVDLGDAHGTGSGRHFHVRLLGIGE